MFFAEDRIAAVREMILAKDVEQRKKALAKILPMQREDFVGIYEALEGRAATIRFYNSPEINTKFLPTDLRIEALAKEMNLEVEEINNTIANLHEFNPMMGHRGCRLSVSYPEIAEMQTRAVIEAAIEVKQNKGFDVVPEIMIPLVGEIKELKYVKEVVCNTAKEVMDEKGVELDFKVGTMIEIPRAALTADLIAKKLSSSLLEQMT